MRILTFHLAPNGGYEEAAFLMFLSLLFGLLEHLFKSFVLASRVSFLLLSGAIRVALRNFAAVLQKSRPKQTLNDTFPSQLLERAVSEIAKLPGIGRKTALRLALHLLRQDKAQVHSLAESMVRLRDEVCHCRVCHNLSDTDLCEICGNPRRDASTVCVVENVSGVLSIEATGQYRGLYHVLGGVISPVDGIGPADLTIQSLVDRVQQGDVKEVILALSPTMEGDTTGFYLSRRLADTGVLLTTLARGISVGDDLEYTDEATLGRALAARVKFN